MRCLTASAPQSVPPGSDRSSASSMVFSTQVTSGIAGHVGDGRGDIIGDGVARAGRNPAASCGTAPRPAGLCPGKGLVAALLHVLAAGAQLAAQQRSAADLGEGGQHGQRGGPAGLARQQRLGPAVPGPGQHAGDDLRAYPGAHPVQDQQQHRCAAGQRQHHPGQQVFQVPDPGVTAGHGAAGSSLVCAASAAANARSWAARRARTAASTAASPAPSSGSLAPGAASLTAESAQASLSLCWPSSGRAGPPAAEAPAPASAPAGPPRGRRVCAGQPRRAGAWPPGSTPARRQPARGRELRRVRLARSLGRRPRQRGPQPPASAANRRVSPDGSRSEPSARPIGLASRRAARRPGRAGPAP